MVARAKKAEVPCDSDKISVKRFGQILIWPLALGFSARDGFADESDVMAAMDKVASEFARSPHWKHIPDLADHAPAFDEHKPEIDTLQSYAERVYFHEFIHSSLFSKNEKVRPNPISLFSRHGKYDVDIVLANPRLTITMRVVRLNVYLYSSGAAALVMELDSGTSGEGMKVAGADGNPRTLTLADVLRLNDLTRRVYPPFFSTTVRPRLNTAEMKFEAISAASAAQTLLDYPPLLHKVVFPSLVAESLTFKLRERTGDNSDRDGGLDGLSDKVDPLRNAKGAKAHLDEQRTPGVFQLWQDVVWPLHIKGMQPPKSSKPLTINYPRFRQVVDERMPLMSFVSLEQKPGKNGEAEALYQVSRSDWVRLCYADGPGSKETYPYAPDFLKNFEQNCCYDRFFPTEDDSANKYSRILNCGYHFCIVGSGWFMDNILQHHFRRHYFQIGLAVNMDIASLLAASGRVTAAVKQMVHEGGTPAARAQFEDTMQVIERDFLEYVHLYRFTGMSNQIQPTEMLEQWQKQLRMETLFTDVRTEIDTANQFIMATEQTKAAESAAKLNVIVILGVVLSLAFGFMGINVLFVAPPGTDAAAQQATGALSTLLNHNDWPIIALVVGISSAIAFVMSLFIEPPTIITKIIGKMPSPQRLMRGALAAIGIAGLATYFMLT
ncbi:MAG: hypothetical protein WA921_13680 [Ahrensia sp.]